MTSQQRGLLHDGIVMAAVSVRVPPVSQLLGACHGLGNHSCVLHGCVGGHSGQLLPCRGKQDLLGPTWPGLLGKQTWLDLKRLCSRGLSDDGHRILHSHGIASVLRGRGLQPLEAGRTHDESLLEGVRPGTDLGCSRLQGHAPLSHCSHGRR